MKKIYFSGLLAFVLFPLISYAQSVHNVNAGSYYFTDIDETVYVGDQVCWFNDGGYHDVNFSGYGNPQDLVDQYLPPNSGGDLGCITFSTPGSFTYDCSIGSHAANGMIATISVVEYFEPDQVSSVSINDCGDFEDGSNSAWAHILTATTSADGASSQEAQTFTMNVTSLPEGGANIEF